MTKWPEAANSISTQVVDRLQFTLHSEEFKSRHRKRPQDFTRNAKLTFPRTISIICGNIQATYENELARMFKVLEGSDYSAVEKPEGSALSHARRKVDPAAFVELNSIVLDVAEQHMEEHFQSWMGHRIIGLDGSTLQLPDTDEIRAEFDPKAAPEAIPHARVSECTDVLNGLVLDEAISSMETGERELFRRHLGRLGGGDFLLTMDRGYAAHWVFLLCLLESIPFVARVKVDHSAAVAAFVASGAVEGEIRFDPADASREVLAEEGVEPVPFVLRAVRIDLDSGETEVLVTNIPEEEMSLDDLSLCYELRWGSETEFRHQKSRLQMENFSGRTVHSVRQDYHARIFVRNLAGVLALPAHAVIREETAHRKHTYFINMANAARSMRQEVIPLLLGCGPGAASALANILVGFASDLSIYRYGRSFERRKKNPGRRFHTVYKPIS